MYTGGVPDPDILFNWDSENTAHLARHKIAPAEVEAFFRSDPAVQLHESIDGEDRWTAVGITNALRVLVIVFTVRNSAIRPITGWDADKSTKREYFRRSPTN